MSYTRVNWENLPSTNTPLNATNLNKMDAGIKDLDNNVSSLITRMTNAETNIEQISGKFEKYLVNINPGEFLRKPLPIGAMIYCHATAANFEKYRVFGYVGENKYANQNQELVNLDYLNNPNASAIIQFVAGDGTDSKEYIDITNNGSIAIEAQIGIVHLF